MTEEQQMNVQEENENFADLLAQQNTAQRPRLEAGQKVHGVIIDIAQDSVFVDVGIKVDGIMERKDILNVEGEEAYKVGDAIEAWIVKVTPHEIRLSRSMSGSGLAALEDACDSKIPVEGRITGPCKGGYTVEVLGKRAFCPGSQMEALGEGEDLAGRTMEFLILRIENHGRNIIVSRRALLNRERAENLAKVLEKVEEGAIVEGPVTRIMPYGCFVELAPGVEGMVHISELSWSHVSTPEEVVAVGTPVRCKVLAITKTEKGTKIALSRKQAEGDPWKNLGDKLEAGQIVTGKVVRFMPFGAFIELFPGVEGMVHLSEMAWGRRVHKPEEELQLGQTVRVKVLDCNLEAKRIALSIREAEGDPWADVEERFPVGSTVEGHVESQSSFGLFVILAPGITGLLSLQALKQVKNQSEYQSKKPGESVTVVIQRIDVQAHKISLLPEGAKEVPVSDRNEWKKHAQTTQPQSLGILGEALQKALQKKH